METLYNGNQIKKHPTTNTEENDMTNTITTRQASRELINILGKAPSMDTQQWKKLGNLWEALKYATYNGSYEYNKKEAKAALVGYIMKLGIYLYPHDVKKGMHWSIGRIASQVK